VLQRQLISRFDKFLSFSENIASTEGVSAAEQINGTGKMVELLK
jgi:hypothetical protein